MYWLKALEAFGAILLLDFCWVKYVRNVANKTPFKAASWAALLYGLSAFLYISIVHDPSLLVPALFGAFIGTYLSVRY